MKASRVSRAVLASAVCVVLCWSSRVFAEDIESGDEPTAEEQAQVPAEPLSFARAPACVSFAEQIEGLCANARADEQQMCTKLMDLLHDLSDAVKAAEGLPETLMAIDTVCAEHSQALQSWLQAMRGLEGR